MVLNVMLCFLRKRNQTSFSLNYFRKKITVFNQIQKIFIEYFVQIPILVMLDARHKTALNLQ